MSNLFEFEHLKYLNLLQYLNYALKETNLFQNCMTIYTLLKYISLERANELET